MRNKLFLVALALLPAIAIAQTGGEYTITGKIGKLTTPAKIYLGKRGAQSFTTDSAVVTNGTFSFTGTVTEPIVAYLLVDHEGVGYQNIGKNLTYKTDVLPVYLEKAVININSKDSAANAEVTGSVLNKDNREFMKATDGPQDKIKQLMLKAQAMTAEQRQQPDFKKMVDAYQQAQLDYKNAAVGFIKSHPDSYLSLMNLTAMAGPTPQPNETEPLYNGLNKTLRESPAGLALKAALDKARPTAIGAVAPEFSQPDTSGKVITLASLRGKYVLVDFWASWCGPCRQENPNVVQAYNKYKNKNFTILGVSLDRPNGKTAWLEAIKADGLTWTQVSDLKFWANEAAVLYGVNSIPQNFLIGPDGKIVAKNLRGQALDDVLAELLGKI